MLGKPLTLSGSTYKQLRTISNTINNVADVVAMGGDVREDLIKNLLIQLGEQTMHALRQIDADIERKERLFKNDTIAN